MSEEQLKAFLDAVKADPVLQEKLKGAANPTDVEAIAKQAGFVISADAFARASQEISEDELAGLAGGLAAAPDTKCANSTTRCMTSEL